MAGRKKTKKTSKTNKKKSESTGQLFNFARDSYLERTSRPVYAIAFLLPFIAFYEIGTILINTDVLNKTQVRVVAFVWLQQFLQHLGTTDRMVWIAPPLVVIVILIGLQLASRKSWYFCLGDYTPMVVECTVLAVPLIVLSLLFNGSAAGQGDILGAGDGGSPPLASVAIGPSVEAVASGGVPVLASPEQTHSLMANIVTGVGAGIYEELVFRLILICLLMLLFQDVFGLSHANAVVLAVLISAALFSAHHHVVFINGHLGSGEPFDWAKFGFRTIAGVYFAVLFAIRGFGITAGTHAFYDIFATILNAFFFPS